ncbi:MAG: YggT family protein [Peptostreptococcales bacterium]
MWQIAEAVDKLFDVIYYLVIIRILLSWFVRDPRNRFYALLVQVTEPILAPFRMLLLRFVPDMRIDFSPIIAILVLNMLRSAIINLLLTFVG